jgi:hypothetical protein
MSQRQSREQSSFNFLFFNLVTNFLVLILFLKSFELRNNTKHKHEQS